MKLRLGQNVNTTDGPFGKLSDIVIDPHRCDVTHLVVEPDHHHALARLVPVWLVNVVDDVITIELDEKHARQLQYVAGSEFIRLDEAIEVGDDWDIGAQNVVAMPYYSDGIGMDGWDDEVLIEYDRIPKGECEIRRSSEVVSSDGRSIGHVEGFLVDDDHLAGVVVMNGLPGLRHPVVVPMGAVARVENDRVELNIDRARFKRLPEADGLSGPLGDSQVEHLERRARQVANTVGATVSSMAGRTKAKVMGSRRRRRGGLD